MYRKNDKTKGIDGWECAVQKRARSAANYRRRMADPAKAEAHRARQRARWPARAADPAYQLDRQLYELARVRVRY